MNIDRYFADLATEESLEAAEAAKTSLDETIRALEGLVSRHDLRALFVLRFRLTIQITELRRKLWGCDEIDPQILDLEEMLGQRAA